MKRISLILSTLPLFIQISVNAYAAPVPVFVVNSPKVTVENPQTSVTVDNSAANPVPVEQRSYRYAGHSTTFTLPAGINHMHATCQTDFGNEARMCTTREFYETPEISSITLAAAPWIEPVISSMISNGSVMHYVVVGGRVLADGLPLPDITGVNCNGWADPNGGHRGTVINHDPPSDAYFISWSVCNVSRPVACCIPQ